MHHTLKLYSRYRERALKFYIFGGWMTRIPLVGNLVKWAANSYGRNLEGAYLLTTKEAEEIVDNATELSLGPCACREVFNNCDNPVSAEIMLGFNENIFVEERPDDYRKISKEEARDILRDSHSRGLIHSIIKYRRDFYAICNCCSCCCVPLRLNKQYGIGNALNKHGNIVEEFRKQQGVEAR